ncbi:hypothetical protein [Paucibacter sp. KBW04]|uniref:hypothetical protein n=1 Tax=Paucibacter sp. KBW04 TaxID=2153361 RepID=UPI000F5635C1|nr:hypothetical protein [Paucibacter sp. KBW04]
MRPMLWLRSAVLLAPAIGTAMAQAPQLSLAAPSPSRAKPCVAMHALPLEQSLLIAPAVQGDEAARQALDQAALQQGVLGQDLESALAEAKLQIGAAGDDPAKNEWTEAKSQAVAAKGFAACAQRIYGEAVLPRLAACEFDLATLPVVLLYRVDGQSRKEALADMTRNGGLGDGSEQARRAPLMLAFAYQGPAPKTGEGRTWIDRRVADWTEQCLAGRLVLPK